MGSGSGRITRLQSKCGWTAASQGLAELEGPCPRGSVAGLVVLGASRGLGALVLDLMASPAHSLYCGGVMGKEGGREEEGRVPRGVSLIASVKL